MQILDWISHVCNVNAKEFLFINQAVVFFCLISVIRKNPLLASTAWAGNRTIKKKVPGTQLDRELTLQPDQVTSALPVSPRPLTSSGVFWWLTVVQQSRAASCEGAKMDVAGRGFAQAEVGILHFRETSGRVCTFPLGQTPATTRRSGQETQLRWRADFCLCP